jgi:hypothetical protein
LDPNQEFQNLNSSKEHPMLIVGMEGLYFDTQENELELLGCMRPTKAHQKDKKLKCIVDFVHLKFMATSYNHHFMFYSWDMSNVTQLIPSQVWKVMYKDYKKKFPDSEFHFESLKDRL